MADVHLSLHRAEGYGLNIHEMLEIGSEPGRCVVVDASRGIQAVAGEVWAIVRKRFDL
jgi:thymidylate kinase